MMCKYRPKSNTQRSTDQRANKKSQVERKRLSLKVCAVRHENVPKIARVLENNCADDDADDPDERASGGQVESHSGI